MLVTPFSAILQRAVERIPGAIGAIFADWEGEAVASFTARDGRDDLVIVAAHYGVILNYVQSVLHLSHFGEAEEIILRHAQLDLIVRAVDKHYYVILAADPGAHLATARREVAATALALRAEI